MFGVWEPNISNAIENLLIPGDVFVDVGANIGYDTLLASTLVGSSGTVVSIEALPSTFENLSKNVACNSAKNVRIVNAAVAEKSGPVTIYSAPKANIGASTIVKGREFF